jgi:translation initiation factor IF-2
VVVEKKRKRIVPPRDGVAATSPATGTGTATTTQTAPAAKTQTGGTTLVAKTAARPEPASQPARPSAPAQRPQGDRPAAERTGGDRPGGDRSGGARGGGGRPDGRPGGERRGAGGKPNMLRSLSEEEYARRLVALKQAKRDDEERRKREEIEAKRAEEARVVAEAEAVAQAERDAREAAERAAAEVLAAKEAAESAAVEAADAATRAISERSGVAPRPPRAAAKPEASPADPTQMRHPGEEPPAQDQRDRRSTGPVVKKKEKELTPAKPRVAEDKRRTGKLTISKLGDEDGGRQRSMAAMRRRQERSKSRGSGRQEPREKVIRDVILPEAITVQELANRMAERVSDLIKSMMKSGIMVTQNETIDQDTAELLIEEFGHRVTRVSEADVEEAIVTTSDDEDDLTQRAPVVTIMGHVDHGKTSLLDALRKTNIVSGEAGGITQHIGAYQIVTEGGQKITFLDTPGHAAFTSMRARGAQVTDIVILVVAADDSVMPQTVEAISHAKAAGVPMIVAINKIDRPGADPQKVRTELLRHEVVVEEMSGDVLDVEVSALKGLGLDKLLDAIVLQSEVLELRANVNRPAEGAVIEAKLDVGRGPVATVLVQRGTLRPGDIFVVGEQWGKVRALVNDKGERIEAAGPSEPVEVLGLNGTPEAGDVLNVVEDEAKAREIADYRQRKARERQAAVGTRTTLDQLLAQAKTGTDLKELPLVVKADVQGSTEAIVQALEKLGNEEVRVRLLHSGVGAITESDVTLAEASGAPIIGFNVRANASARASANQKGVEIRYYSIIYDLVDDVKAAASGLLSPEVRERFIGYAKIKQVFKVSGVGKVAGCDVTEGVARRSAGVRLLRDNVVIHEGTLKTLKRFKDEVKEVQVGQECGMAFENYEDIRDGDVIEIFERETIQRTL